MKRADAAAQLDQGQAAAADTGVKAMIPIKRPFLDYVMTGLAEAGYRQVCLVVAPQHDVLRDYYTVKEPPKRLTIDFAVQVEPRGTADAVAAAEQFAAGDHFIMLNSDNYYPLEALRRLRELPTAGVALFHSEVMISQSNIPAERLKAFSVGEIAADGRLMRILEKPDDATLARLPRPLWVSMNCWRFGPAIFDGCRAIGPSPRGEYEVTDAVQYTIDRLGERIEAVRVEAPVLDMSSRQDIASIAARLGDMEVSY